MEDAAQEVSQALSLQIVEQKNKKLTVQITADRSWLDNESRQYPVTVDPVIMTEQKTQDIIDTYVDSSLGGDIAPYDEYLYVGHNGLGTCRTYIKFVLPNLEKGAMVVGSTLNLYTEQCDVPSTGAAAYINVYDVGAGSFNNTTLKWGNQPTSWMSNPIIDYKQMKNEPNKWMSFDVTKSVKSWYLRGGTVSNTGFVLKSSDESISKRIRFLSSDNIQYTTNDGYPMLMISYLHNGGLESYWSYHEQNLGHGATGYVNDYTGNLVVDIPLASTTGERMPMSVSCIYNGYQAGAFNNNGVGVVTNGKGMQLNVSKRFEKVTNTQLAKNYPYVLLDGDGTRHYFKLKSGSTTVWEDEEGLEMSLTKISQRGVTYFSLTYKDGYKDKFANADTGIGRLVSETDVYGNSITYQYSDERLSTITDGAGRTTTIATRSADSQFLSSITTPDGKQTTFTYSGNLLTEIHYFDGRMIHLEYDDEQRLIKVFDVDNSYVKYDYCTNTVYQAERNRVARVTEYSAPDSGGSTVVGASMLVKYTGDNITKFVYDDNSNGVQDSNELEEKYVFNNVGQLKCVMTPNGSVSYNYKSSTFDKDKDKISQSGLIPPKVNNLAVNHSIENDAANWSTYNAVSGAILLVSDSHSYLGEKSLKVGQIGDSLRTAYKQAINISTLSAATDYTLSAFMHTVNVTGEEGNGALLFAECYGDSGYLGTFDGEKYLGTSSWKRTSLTFQAPAGTNRIVIHVGLYKAGGSAYFDCIQLESGSTMNDYNMIENGNFTSASNWTGTALASGDGHQSDNTYRLTGRPGVSASVSQQINIRKANICFAVSGQARANAVPGHDFAIDIGVYYADGTAADWKVISFNKDTSGWQYTSDIVIPKKDKVVSYIKYYFIYYNNANQAYFDDCALYIDESGTSYTYDSKGNVISATDNAKRQESYQFNDANELTQKTDVKSDIYKYTYYSDNEHKLKSARSEKLKVGSNFLGYSFSYTSHGNVSNTKLGAINSSGEFVSTSPYMESSTGYSSDGNYVTSTTDQRGYTTTRNVNAQNGLLNSVTDSKGNTTNYVYDSSYRIGQVNTQRDGQKIANYYGYKQNGKISSIYQNGFNYNFAYDQFGNNTSINVQNARTLITNTYGPNNGPLTKSVYGNGDSFSYTYDNLDRVTQKTFGSTAQFGYTYDRRGNVALHKDHVLGVDYRYTYDLSNRLIRKAGSNGTSIDYEYDNANRQTKTTYTIGGVTQTASNTYGPDGRNEIDRLIFGGYVSRGYDSLNREIITDINPVEGVDPRIRINRSFVNVSGNKTTSLIKNYNTAIRQSGEDDILQSYDYKYDKNGNITEVRTHNHFYQYGYDSQNQLIWSNEAAVPEGADELTGMLGTHTQYTYDAGGNITQKQYYDVAMSLDGDWIVGAPIKDPDTYTYGDANWKDLLTAYNGKTITYDQIGNPLTYYNGMQFTWQGRQLTRWSTGSRPTSYKYNADGLRTRKTYSGQNTYYYYDGTRLIAEKPFSGGMIWYLYSGAGELLGLRYKDNNYWYCKNAQGDVIGPKQASY